MCVFIFISRWKNREILFWMEKSAISNFMPSQSIADQTGTVSVCALYQGGRGDERFVGAGVQLGNPREIFESMES